MDRLLYPSRNSKAFLVQSFKSFGTALLPVVFGVSSIVAVAQAPVSDSPIIEAQARVLLAKLTLEQKIDLIGGDGQYTRAEPSIGLPRFKMSDASLGVCSWGPTAAYAGGVALAATWDTRFAHLLGGSLGRDARARGVNFLLGPGVNIARSPVAGRNFEYLSEDPFLNSALVAPFIQGVQSEGVIATVKHYALNNEEFDRHNTSADVDERTMREIYLPAFEAAITRGGADAVMSSYNLVNGVHASENEFLNLKVLKGDWGFKGILMSDWDATYDGVAAAANGLDLEMPDAKFMNARNLMPAIKSGELKESTIDDKVLRLLRTELRYGFTTRPQFDPRFSIYSVADRHIALDGALESITLLKNDGNLLPLPMSKPITVAVIGPDAWPAVAGGGGASHSTAFTTMSIVTGIGDLLGPEAHILYSRGLPEINEVFSSTRWVNGVKVMTFPTKNFTGTPEATRQREVAGWRPGQWEAPDISARSIRYSAEFKAPNAGTYLLLAAASGEDTFKIFVDGKQIFEQIHAEGQVPKSTSLNLVEGQTIKLTAEYVPYAEGTRFGFGLAYEPGLVSTEAKQYAAVADVVVVAVGFDAATEGEGHDRTFALPWGQNTLIDAMVAANPRTIVTLTGGGGMDVEPWIDKVPVLLHLYYPGQEGGAALADLLFGRHDPEGKLPISFDRSWNENPSAKWYYDQPDANTVLRSKDENGKPRDYTIQHVRYGDKLMVGYRYWMTVGRHPLFPFGFGLSYTSFSFSNLQVPATAAAGSTVSVSFDVTNTGHMEGAEVAQLYVSDPSAKVDRPERELRGFEKVRLMPGETNHVTIDLDAAAFSYWDESAHGWTIDRGKFTVHVGDSSENTPLSANLTLE